MIDGKNSRGRPKGSSRYAHRDEQAMLIVADLMAANPSLNMTDTIRRVIDTSHDTGGVRRLQIKLKGRLEHLVNAARERLIEVQREQEVQQIVDALEVAIPQMLTGMSNFIREHEGEIREFLFVMKLRNKSKEYICNRLGITDPVIREFAKHLVAFGIILRDFSKTDGMPHLEHLAQRLSSMSWMVAASDKLAQDRQADTNGKAA